MQIDGMGAAQPKGVGTAPKSPQQTASKAADKGEEVSLNKPPKWAQVLIQQALQFALEINGQHYQAPRSEEFKLESPEAITPETLFDYETVADNVLQFVTGRLGAARADGKSDEDLAEMMAQARKGVDMGFGDARKQLGDWADNEDIKTGMDQSYKLIQEGLESFEKEFFGEVSTTDLGAARMASRQQAFLEIETRDGDKVMLRFSDSWQFRSRNDGSGNQFSLKSSQSFDFSLEGDLDGAEMEAIGTLVKGLDELAGQFFGGTDGKTLADRLAGLQLDDSQLVSYSLKLKQSAKLSQAYQGAHSLQESLKPLADYLPRLSRVQQQADALLPTAQQQALTPAVLAARGQDGATGAGFMGFNQRMLEAMRLLGQQMAAG
ncbi:DUF5610 domain-containing protein [Aeromonas sp. FDAARGOS 1409]|uniref:DUF5610 domain-containing protein n=2 Tax=Aeromonadaceae TaxID=84642 RepID=UPI001C218FD5|nr:DUF5610 domain-containing protein [Aeromonas sp. FDAARGOS 1409]QXC32096.1 DUF5610 domain-containing protein [Aeromonas sp. FDAARGOS 1409]